MLWKCSQWHSIPFLNLSFHDLKKSVKTLLKTNITDIPMQWRRFVLTSMQGNKKKWEGLLPWEPSWKEEGSWWCWVDIRAIKQQGFLFLDVRSPLGNPLFQLKGQEFSHKEQHIRICSINSEKSSVGL